MKITQKMRYLSKKSIKYLQKLNQHFKDEIILDNFRPIIKPPKKKKNYTTTKTEGYPQKYIFEDHLFVFANRRTSDCRYVCKYGSNKHKGKKV